MANQFDQDLLVDDLISQDTLGQNKLGQDPLASQDASDSEWEYEYDATETEDFYFTLDLTTHVPPQHRARQYQSNKTASTAIDPALGEANHGSFTSKASDPTGRADQLQILELHSDNPLISYQNQLYSCRWADAVGTDLLFTTDVARELAETTAYSGEAFALLAATHARLIGRPVQLTQRADVAAAPTDEVETPGKSNADGDTTMLDTSGDAAAAAQQTYLSKSRQGQARFLARLAAAKAARGEVDAVPVYVEKGSMQETGRGRQSTAARDGDEEEDEEAVVDEDDEESDDDDGAFKPTARGQGRGRGRGRGRDRGRARGAGSERGARARKQRVRAAGGLFRDYRPAADEEAGAELRMGTEERIERSAATPEQ